MKSKFLVGSSFVTFQAEMNCVVNLLDCKSVMVDNNGWIALYPVVEDPAIIKYRVPIEGSYPAVDGIRIHILLHVIDGFVRVLEVFKEDGSAVIQHPEASTLKLFCPTGGEPA